MRLPGGRESLSGGRAAVREPGLSPVEVAVASLRRGAQGAARKGDLRVE